MTKRRTPPDELARLCEAESEAWRRRSSVHFLECAIHLCATNMSISELAARLEKQAQYLRQFG